MFSNFLILCSEVLHHWFDIVAGAVVSIVLLILDVRFKIKLAWKGALAIFGVGLFIALFFAWQDEYTSAQWRGMEIGRLKGELEAQQAQETPKLIGKIYAIGATVPANNHNDTDLFVEASIRNLGAYSVADSFSLHVLTETSTLNGIQIIPGEGTMMVEFPEGQKLSFPLATYLPRQALAGISKNGEVEGYYRARILGV